ncbi:MAG: hypothetical protein GY755_16300 [Chloroflexi bacterium]|nr:hypothetical protein [Chloroflexota bacterium]
MSYQLHFPFIYDDQPAVPRDRRILRIILLVGLIYYGTYFFIFRDIIFHLPELMSGEMVINGDELVPFFNPHSQFLEQAAGEFNDLTNGYEFRVRYSILSTWMRYYKVLPFALLLVVPSVAFASYLVVSYFLQRVMPYIEKSAAFRAPIAPILLVYLILSYTKITHFYTLILGFGIFLIATLFFSYGFIFSQRHPYRYMIVGHLLTVFNPAIHYIVLYCMFISLLIVGIVLIEIWEYYTGGSFWHKLRFSTFRKTIKKHRQNKSLSGTPIVKAIGAFALLVVITLIPYALFVKFFVLTGIDNISESIPVTYYFIKDASVSFSHLVSFDLAGIMDKFISGNYLSPHPRVTNIFYTFMMLSPLFVPGVKRIIFVNRPLKLFFTISYLILFFSCWATLGYSGPDYLPTFHRAIAWISNAANNSRSTVGDLIVQLMGTIVQILRFPHRFQLILFMMAAIVLPVSTLWLEKKYRTWIDSLQVKRKNLYYALFHLLFLMPLLLNWQYRETFASGNYLGFLSPYPVTPLKETKDYLLTLPEGKTVVFPPTETAKRIIDINGVEHKFIDKFHIYYLDLPSYYYGLSGDPSNKHEFFLLLRAMYYDQSWWVNIARDNQIKYIIINKELVANTVGGAEYLRDIEKTIRSQMNELDEYFRKTFENESYIVYELIDLPVAERIPLFIDTEWNTFIWLQTKYPQLSKYYDLRYGMKSSDLDEYDSLVVVADDMRQARLDIYAKTEADTFFQPDSIMFPFDQNVVSSTYYIAPMFRMFQFFSDTKWNRLEMITPGMYGSITGRFIGVPRSTTFRIDIKIPEDGKYHLLLRGVSSANSLTVEAPSLGINQNLVLMPEDSKANFFQQDRVFTPDRQPYDVSSYSIEELEDLIPQRIVMINYGFQYIDLGVVNATAGTHTIYFTKDDENPILIEGVMSIPAEDFDELPLQGDITFVDPEEKLCCDVFENEANTSTGE